MRVFYLKKSNFPAERREFVRKSRLQSVNHPRYNVKLIYFICTNGTVCTTTSTRGQSVYFLHINGALYICIFSSVIYTQSIYERQINRFWNFSLFYRKQNIFNINNQVAQVGRYSLIILRSMYALVSCTVQAARLKTYKSLERNELIFFWHHVQANE